MNKKYIYSIGIIIILLIVFAITLLMISIVNGKNNEEKIEDVIYEIKGNRGTAPNITYDVKVNSDYNLKVEIEMEGYTAEGRQTSEASGDIVPPDVNKDILKEILNNISNIAEPTTANTVIGEGYLIVDKVNNKKYMLPKGKEQKQLFYIINDEELTEELQRNIEEETKT